MNKSYNYLRHHVANKRAVMVFLHFAETFIVAECYAHTHTLTHTSSLRICYQLHAEYVDTSRLSGRAIVRRRTLLFGANTIVSASAHVNSFVFITRNQQQRGEFEESWPFRRIRVILLSRFVSDNNFPRETLRIIDPRFARDRIY